MADVLESRGPLAWNGLLAWQPFCFVKQPLLLLAQAGWGDGFWAAVAASRLIHEHGQEPMRPHASTGQAAGGMERPGLWGDCHFI